MTNSNTNATGSMQTVWQHPWYQAQLRLGLTTTSDAQSTPNPKSETTGRTCTKCGETKPIEDFRNEKSRNWHITDNNKAQAYRRQECKDCEKRLAKQLREAKKSAPPKPPSCACCGRETDKLVVDHDHDTGTFRGWICTSCNIGIGKLGDTLQGVQNALNYLNETTD